MAEKDKSNKEKKVYAKISERITASKVSEAIGNDIEVDRFESDVPETGKVWAGDVRFCMTGTDSEGKAYMFRGIVNKYSKKGKGTVTKL